MAVFKKAILLLFFNFIPMLVYAGSSWSDRFSPPVNGWVRHPYDTYDTFREDKKHDCYSKNPDFKKECKGLVKKGVVDRDCDYKGNCSVTKKLHTGIDYDHKFHGHAEDNKKKSIRNYIGRDYEYHGPADNIVAVNGGKVVLVTKNGSRDRGLGNSVIIEHYCSSSEHLCPNGKIYSLYAHLARILTYKGAQVVKGAVIGHIGGTANGQISGLYGSGYNTGWLTHLHFEMKTKGVLDSPVYCKGKGTNNAVGYTTEDPKDCGYRDPKDYFDKVSIDLICYPKSRSKGSNSCDTNSPAPTVKKVYISGCSSVKEHEACSYTAKARFSDGKIKTVDAKFTVLSDKSYADFSNSKAKTARAKFTGLEAKSIVGFFKRILYAFEVKSKKYIRIRAEYQGVVATKQVKILDVPKTSSKSVKSIALQGCSSTLNERSRCKIKARVKYSDGSSKYIYPSTSGASFSENSRYAYLSGKYLRIKSVNRNEKVTVKVIYKGKSATQHITIRNNGSSTSSNNKKTVKSLSLKGCSSTLNERSRCKIKARVKYSDGSSQYIYPSTSGASFSENSRYAYLSGKYLRIKSVNRNEKVTVKVRYKGKSATQRITIRNTGSTTSSNNNKTVKSLSLKGCPTTMYERYRCKIKARVKYSDGSSKYIYPSTSGASFSENSRYSYISGKYLTFRSVNSNKRVTVKVRYKGKTATKRMTIRNR